MPHTNRSQTARSSQEVIKYHTLSDTSNGQAPPHSVSHSLRVTVICLDIPSLVWIELGMGEISEVSERWDLTDVWYRDNTEIVQFES